MTSAEMVVVRAKRRSGGRRPDRVR